MRWGTNVVVQTSMALNDGFGITNSFATTFESNTSSNECQAADGDSGGAVFYNNGTQWLLAGMMYSIDGTGANNAAAYYGGQTYSVDLSSYAKYLKPIPGDANDDGLVDVADYNIWAANVGTSGASWKMGDFNGDGLVDVADYNIWAANVGATASGNMSMAPEPALDYPPVPWRHGPFATKKTALDASAQSLLSQTKLPPFNAHIFPSRLILLYSKPWEDNSTST